MGSKGEIKGDRYTTAELSDDENKRESDSDDEFVLNLKREVDDDDDNGGDDKGKGFSGREYALITESMWFTGLKW